jgi:pyrroloquinoline quinone biosynthesis protein D
MTERATVLAMDAQPHLADFVRPQFDKARETWILQAPERVLVLDDISKEILDRCDGETSLEKIITSLAQEYDAPKDVIGHDVLAVLELLLEKGFLKSGASKDSA